MRRNLTWTEIAEEYGLDIDNLAHKAAKRGFRRNQAGQLITAPCKECDMKHTRGHLEPSRVCYGCRSKEIMNEPWYDDYREARQKFLEKMKRRGFSPGDLADPRP